MPIYEEKIISPLAVRFTQEHIRTTFKDGRAIEASLAEIRAEPGEGDYDLILRAPFPAIEIIRFTPPATSTREDHWFSLDNRRLYCLQRAATSYWPRRVGVVVEILYADPGAIRRKYDTTTCGQSVTVAHSCKDAVLFTWDWHEKALQAGGLEVAAFEAVRADDLKHTVDQLADVGGKSDALSRLLAASMSQTCECGGGKKIGNALPSYGDRTPSTVESTDCSDDDGALQTRAKGISNRHAVLSSLEAAAASAAVEIERQLVAPHSNGRVWLPDWNARYASELGSLRRFLESWPEKFKVIPGDGRQYFVELTNTSVQPSHDTGAMRSAPHGEKSGDEGRVNSVSVAAAAVSLVEEQLAVPGNGGYIWIENWKSRFYWQLGPLKKFLESRPDKFRVFQGYGNQFRVFAAESVQSKAQRHEPSTVRCRGWRARALGNVAA